MKATKLLLATVLFAGLASLSLAGPGSDYWAQQTKNAKEQKVQAKAQAQADAPVQTCSQCSGCAGMQKS